MIEKTSPSLKQLQPVIKCPSCKNQVSSSAITCPSCGYQLQQPRAVPFYVRASLQKGPTAPRTLALYALAVAVIAFALIPMPFKIVGSVVAVGIAAVSVARGCYGLGTIGLIVSTILAAVGILL